MIHHIVIIMNNYLHKWFRETPFTRFLVPFAAGILIQNSFQFQHFLLPIFGALITVVLFIHKVLFKSFHFNWIYGIVLNMSLLFAGILCHSVHNKYESPIQYIDVIAVAEVIELPQEKSKTIKSVIKIKECTYSSLLNTQVLTYFSKGGLNYEIKQGDVITFKTSVSKINSLGNPHEFDYRAYLK